MENYTYTIIMRWYFVNPQLNLADDNRDNSAQLEVSKLSTSVRVQSIRCHRDLSTRPILALPSARYLQRAWLSFRQFAN